LDLTSDPASLRGPDVRPSRFRASRAGTHGTQLGGVVWEFVRMDFSIPALDARDQGRNRRNPPTAETPSKLCPATPEFPRRTTEIFRTAARGDQEDFAPCALGGVSVFVTEFYAFHLGESQVHNDERTRIDREGEQAGGETVLKGDDVSTAAENLTQGRLFGWCGSDEMFMRCSLSCPLSDCRSRAVDRQNRQPMEPCSLLCSMAPIRCFRVATFRRHFPFAR
jgi:hypothetical protein